MYFARRTSFFVYCPNATCIFRLLLPFERLKTCKQENYDSICKMSLTGASLARYIVATLLFVGASCQVQARHSSNGPANGASCHPSAFAGKLQWTTQFPASNGPNASFYGLPVTSSSPQYVFVAAQLSGGSANGTSIAALDKMIGGIAWAVNVADQGQYLAACPGPQEILVFGGMSAIYAFDQATGNMLWSTSFTNPALGTPGAQPARVVCDASHVFFTAENGPLSTALHVLGLDGLFLFKTDTIATSRPWLVNGSLYYVEQAFNGSSATVAMVKRSATVSGGLSLNVLWRRPYDPTSFGLNGGGSVVFDPNVVLVMLSPSSAGPAPPPIQLAVLDGATGQTQAVVNFSSQTNNFDFSYGGGSFWSLESHGPPLYANATMSAFSLHAGSVGRPLWRTEITTGAPNLLPGAAKSARTGNVFPVALAQGSDRIVAVDALTGTHCWSRHFSNPNQEIGIVDDRVLFIGDTNTQTVNAVWV